DARQAQRPVATNQRDFACQKARHRAALVAWCGRQRKSPAGACGVGRIVQDLIHTTDATTRAGLTDYGHDNCDDLIRKGGRASMARRVPYCACTVLSAANVTATLVDDWVVG